MDYQLLISGLQIRLCMPFAMRPHKSLLPFLSESPTPHWDVRYTILPSPQKTPIPADAPCVFVDGRMQVFHTENGDVRCFPIWDTDAKSTRNPILYPAAPNDFRLYYPPEQLGSLRELADFTKFLGIETVLAGFGRFLLHSSVVRLHNRAVLFSAASGVGKSTQAELWRKCFQAEILNGDRSIIEESDGKFIAHGSPFSGSSQIYRNEAAEIRCIFLLEQAAKNEIVPVAQADAVRALFRESVVALWDQAQTAAVLDELLCLTASVPVLRLRCLPNEAAASLAMAAAFPGK